MTEKNHAADVDAMSAEIIGAPRFERDCAPRQDDSVEVQAVECLMSIAISLKRIADAITKTSARDEPRPQTGERIVVR